MTKHFPACFLSSSPRGSIDVRKRKGGREKGSLHGARFDAIVFIVQGHCFCSFNRDDHEAFFLSDE